MIIYRPIHFRALNAMLLFLIGMAFSASMVGIFWNVPIQSVKIDTRTQISDEKRHIELYHEPKSELKYLKDF